MFCAVQFCQGGILAKACEYLSEIRSTNLRLSEQAKQAETAQAEAERLTAQVEQLQAENTVLKQQLASNGLVPAVVSSASQDIKFSM